MLSESPSTALSCITRLAQRQESARKWLGLALERRLDTLALVALDVAVETGDPIGQILAQKIQTASIDLARRLYVKCYDGHYRHSLLLREVALEATRRCLEDHRIHVVSLEIEERSFRAALLNNLGYQLSELGRHEEALAAN